MNRKEKENFVADLHSRLEEAQGTFLLDYKGLKVEEINRLRNELRNSGAEFQVVKNRLLKLACDETHTELIKNQMQGPSAITIAFEDVIGPAKILVDFARDFNQLQFKSGQISGKRVDEEAIKTLARLPGREVLLSQALAAMRAVPTGFVRVLSGIMSQLLNVLKAIEIQKET